MLSRQTLRFYRGLSIFELMLTSIAMADGSEA